MTTVTRLLRSDPSRRHPRKTGRRCISQDGVSVDTVAARHAAGVQIPDDWLDRGAFCERSEDAPRTISTSGGQGRIR